jgi:hypothetical protein
MGHFNRAEIAVGSVVHVDTSLIRTLGGAATNAEVVDDHDRAVVGPHYFLIVDIDGDSCVAMPIFSRPTAGSIRLAEGSKTGLPDDWMGRDSYVSKWQHWRIPLSSIVAASGSDRSTSTTRRAYKGSGETAPQRLMEWQHQNRAPFRLLN